MYSSSPWAFFTICCGHGNPAFATAWATDAAATSGLTLTTVRCFDISKVKLISPTTLKNTFSIRGLASLSRPSMKKTKLRAFLVFLMKGDFATGVAAILVFPLKSKRGALQRIRMHANYEI